MPKSEIILKIKPDFRKYLNVNRYFSYDANWYFIIGGRGIGKTTGFNIHNIMDFKKNGNEFTYIRRYQDELKKDKLMLDPIVNNKVNIEGYGDGAFEWRINKCRVGFGVALSAQRKLKSGLDFSKVRYSIYDEAILPTANSSDYLPNEVETFLELMSTIYRDRTDYKVFILGNNANIFNIYFEYFGIPNFKSNYYDRERGIYCEYATNSPTLIEAEKKTPLYKLTKGTAYADYHYDNKVLIVNKAKIGEKPKVTQLLCRILFKNNTINLYAIGKGLTLFAEMRDKQIIDNLTFKLYDEQGNPNKYYIKEFRATDMGKLIIERYYVGDMIFDNEITAEFFQEFLATTRA